MLRKGSGLVRINIRCLPASEPIIKTIQNTRPRPGLPQLCLLLGNCGYDLCFKAGLTTYRFYDSFCSIVVLLSYFFQFGLPTCRICRSIAETKSHVNQGSQLRLREHAIALIQERTETVKENESRLTGVVSGSKFLALGGAKIRQYECDAILVLRSERVNDALKRAAMLSGRIVDLNNS